MSAQAASSTDFIEVYDDVIDAQHCQRLIERFENDQRKGAGRTGHGVDLSKKNSIDLTLTDHADWQDEAFKLQQALFKPLCDYMRQYFFLVIGALSPTVTHPKTGEPVGLTAENFGEFGDDIVPQLVNHMYRSGRLNMQKYLVGKGNYNHWHSEVYPQQGSVDPLHRVLLFQFYLNPVQDGGHTNFYYQGRKVRPKRGRLVIAPAGFTHTHRGEIPKSEDKYVITSWVLFKPAEAIYGQAQQQQ
ncbi:MAG: 2OG-Fe(II) oxygenase [Xanthomonadales bacterium]|jgi:hypothetical protein|nr:2OG-Fe(II) oxygenase [Xanthomonadales bacterium]